MASRGQDQTREGISACHFCMLLLKPLAYHHHQEFQYVFFSFYAVHQHREQIKKIHIYLEGTVSSVLFLLQHI